MHFGVTMHNYWKPGWERIRAVTAGRNVSDFAKKIGVSPNTVRGWIRSQSIEECAFPGVDKLGEIAKALGCEPWELIKPEHALHTASPTEEQLLEMIKERDKKIRDLEEISLKIEDPDLFARFIKAWQRLDHNQRKSITGSAEARADDRPKSNESIEKKRKA